VRKGEKDKNYLDAIRQCCTTAAPGKIAAGQRDGGSGTTGRGYRPWQGVVKGDKNFIRSKSLGGESTGGKKTSL